MPDDAARFDDPMPIRIEEILLPSSRHSLAWRRAASATALAAALVAVPAQAQGVSDDVVRIGLLLDMSGLYADLTGEGSVHAVRMAVEDFGGKVLGQPIEVLFADHQNKADIAAAKAREWFDAQKLDVIGDVAASATALAAAEVARTKGKPALLTGPAPAG